MAMAPPSRRGFCDSFRFNLPTLRTLVLVGENFARNIAAAVLQVANSVLSYRGAFNRPSNQATAASPLWRTSSLTLRLWAIGLRNALRSLTLSLN